jgi:hypothetical protein
LPPPIASEAVYPLIAEELGKAGTGAGRAKFLAEAALVVRTAASIDRVPDAGLEAALTAIERELHSFRHMALGDNSLRKADLVYPYAALSGLIRPSPFYECRLDDFARTGNRDPDRPAYRACEDQFILYMAGRAKLPALCDGHWAGFVSRVYDFNVEHCYWFTHRYLFASDMGAVETGLDWVAPAMLLVAAKAVRWDNVDLFFEAAFCALSSGALPEWVAAIDAWSERLLPRLLEQASGASRDVYHELFLYRLFRMRRDSLSVPPGPADHESAQAVVGLLDALASKSPQRIAETYLAARPVCRHRLFAEACLAKLDWLEGLARAGTLFDNEAMRSAARPAPDLYDNYLEMLGEAVEAIRRPGPGAEQACAA